MVISLASVLIANSFIFWGMLKVEEKIKHNMETIQGGTNGNNIDDKFQDGATTHIPGLVPIKPFVSVFRRMPHKNHDEHPGFNSDYSRPRTRPPSHN